MSSTAHSISSPTRPTTTPTAEPVNPSEPSVNLTPPANLIPVKIGNVRFDGTTTRIIVPLTACNRADLEEQLAALSTQQESYDVLEWRIDYLGDGESFEASDIPTTLEFAEELAGLSRQLLNHTPILATMRSQKEGGQKSIQFDVYQQLVLELAKSGWVQAIDIELYQYPLDSSRLAHLLAEGNQGPVDLPTASIISQIKAQGVKVVASYHDFHSTPPTSEIIARLRAMAHAGADIAKIACAPRQPCDVLDLLNVTCQARQELSCPLITISLGNLGMLSRLAGSQFGSVATFGMADHSSAPGQIPANQLAEILRIIEPQNTITP